MKERRKFSHTSKSQREQLIDMITTRNYSIKKVNKTTLRPHSSQTSPTALPKRFSSDLEPNLDGTSQLIYLKHYRPDTP
jgi:hypothetical protein